MQRHSRSLLSSSLQSNAECAHHFAISLTLHITLLHCWLLQLPMSAWQLVKCMQPVGCNDGWHFTSTASYKCGLLR
jgi:hypothetical protein